MWIILAIIAILIWGNLSRKSANHPLNNLRRNPFTPVCSTQNTVGDNFGSGCTFVAGVPEPITSLTCTAGGASGGYSCQHIIFPVNPPPIQIQRPVLPSPKTMPPRYPPVTQPIITQRSCCGTSTIQRIIFPIRNSPSVAPIITPRIAACTCCGIVQKKTVYRQQGFYAF
jgi:hypothetical protein